MMKLYSETDIQAIADAVRSKNGKSAQYKVSQLAGAICALNARSCAWNAGREERKLFAEGTFAYNPTVSSSLVYLPTDDNCWINGGRRLNTVAVYSTQSALATSAVSNMTSTGFDLTTSAETDTFILFPFFVGSGQTFTVSYTGKNRGIAVRSDIHGKYVSAEDVIDSAEGAHTYSFTADADGWIYFGFGAYNANATVSFTDISVDIGTVNG